MNRKKIIILVVSVVLILFITNIYIQSQNKIKTIIVDNQSYTISFSPISSSMPKAGDIIQIKKSQLAHVLTISGGSFLDNKITKVIPKKFIHIDTSSGQVIMMISPKMTLIKSEQWKGKSYQEKKHIISKLK